MSKPFKGLVKRFTKKQAELAMKISNDIAEDIDCGESKRDLRMAVSYYADLLAVESQKRADAELKISLFRTAKSMMELSLLHDDGK